MAYKILFTDEALADLEVILEYIRRDNFRAAERFGVSLLNHVELLQTFPYIGALLSNRPDVRKLLHTPVRTYYRLHEDRQLIEILHFWHSSQRDPRL